MEASVKTPGTPSAGYWWLGLLLHGVAGLAVLGAAQVDGRLGFAVLIGYFIVTLGYAVNVDREPRLESSRSAAWVLVCCQILFLGSWLGALGTSQEVSSVVNTAPAGHAVFEGQLYFSSSTNSTRLLMRSNGTSTELVPPGIEDARGFREHEGRLTFFGASGAAEGLWALRSDGSAELLHVSAGRLFLAGDAAFKAVSTCGPFRSETLHQVNLSEVPVQQDGQECASLAAGMELRPSTSRLLGVLLLGVLPQTGLGAWLLLRKRVAGAFVNLFTGLYATVLLIHLLMQGRLVNLLFFLQASSLTYAASTCLAVAANRAAWSVPSSVRSFSAALGSWASHAACLSISAAFALALPEPWAAVAATVLLAVLAPLDPVAARLAAVSFLVLISQVEASASDPGLPESLESIFPSRLLFYLLGTLVLLAEEAYASFEASPKETEMAEEPMLEPEEDQRQTWMLLQAMPLQQLLVLQRTHLQNSGNASYKAGEGEEEC